jgi:hypothetical protein
MRKSQRINRVKKREALRKRETAKDRLEGVWSWSVASSVCL